MRAAAGCLREYDRRIGGLWIEVLIDPAGRPIHVAHGGFGDSAGCATMAVRNRHYAELRGTVRLSVPAL
jgi:hypothetical protein